MEKDVFKIVLGYLKYWYLFLIGAIICIALAFFHLRYNVVPQYYISGKILLSDKEAGAESGLESLSNLGLVKTSKNIQDEIGVLQSYDLLKSTLDELGYEVGYYMEGRFSEIEVYEKALPFKVVIDDSISDYYYGTVGSIEILDENSFNLSIIYDDESVKSETYSFGEIIENEMGSFHLELNDENYNPNDKQPVIVRFRDLDFLADLYSMAIQVYPVYETGGGLLQIELTDAIPQRGIDIIDKLVDIYARRSADHKNILSESTLKLIDERLTLLTTDLDSVERNVENYKRNQNLTDVSSDVARFIQLADETDREISALRIQIGALRSLESSLKGLLPFSPIGSFNIQNGAITGLIQSYNQTLQRREYLVNASGAGNPQVQQINRELSASKNLILSNVQNILSELNSTRNALSSKSSQYKSKISSVPSAERALLGINRDQGLKQNLYLFLLQKREEEALSISVPFSDTRIIEEPRSTSYPISPSKMPIYLGAMLFGVLVPFIFVFAKEKLNTKISSPEELENIVEPPVLARIANSKSKDVIVVSEKNVTPVAELFRLMRHNLKFLSRGKSNQVIMVTSSQSGEGKTFISSNLAMSLAITGKKVVALGFDLRAPKLTKDLGLEYEYGLSDYIVSPELGLDDIVFQYKDMENLHFIGSGAIPPNPGELMLSDRVETLINSLREIYDYVIIDTPPIGKVADGFSLGSLVDATLYVVRMNYTPKGNIDLINKIAKESKLSHMMLVMNDVKIGKSDSYGGYGYGNNQGKNK